MEIQTQLGLHLCILHSNKAKEYFSAAFVDFFASHGIMHQSSCAYTPQPNRIAEQKNHHLLLTRAL